jgi:hypothetical protein
MLATALTINFFSQIGMVRATGGRMSIVKSLLSGYACGLIGLAVCWSLAAKAETDPSDFWALLVVDAALYTVASYCWFHYVNIGDASVRIRVLRELADAGRPLSRQEILDRYSAATIIDSRLERLVASGQLVESGGKYRLGKPRMILVARFFDFLKFVVLGKWPDR